MSGFEYIFTFYGLLLGLAIASAVGNLAEMWRANEVVRVGLAPPLLCVFILLAGAQQWVSFWAARDQLTMTPDTLLMCIGMAVPYTFVSHGMTPAREGSGSFEQFYLDHRRTLMVVLAFPPVLSLIFNLAARERPGLADILLSVTLITAPRVVIPLALAFSRSARAHVVGLSVLCIHTVWRMFPLIGDSCLASVPRSQQFYRPSHPVARRVVDDRLPGCRLPILAGAPLFTHANFKPHDLHGCPCRDFGRSPEAPLGASLAT